MGELLDPLRVVAFVGDGDDVVADAESKEHLGGRRDKGSDVHRRRGWHVCR
jgi:hypothetical protein